MSSNTGLHLIARCVGPSVALLGITGLSMLAWTMAMIVARALANLAI